MLLQFLIDRHDLIAIEPIGAGQFGKVYLATHNTLDAVGIHVNRAVQSVMLPLFMQTKHTARQMRRAVKLLRCDL